jgi:hypothetical protein
MFFWVRQSKEGYSMKNFLDESVTRGTGGLFGSSSCRSSSSLQSNRWIKRGLLAMILAFVSSVALFAGGSDPPAF